MDHTLPGPRLVRHGQKTGERPAEDGTGLWCPVTLPLIQAPSGVQLGALCRLVHGAPPVIWGEGNPNGSLLVILDNPGRREHPDGTPLVCPTRCTLQEALRDVGIPLETLQVLFLFKCWPTGRYDREEAARVMVPWLLATCSPSTKAVVAAGNTVLRALFGPDADVKTFRGMDLSWADRPLRATYHPLAARRRPALYPYLVEDLHAVREWGAGG